MNVVSPIYLYSEKRVENCYIFSFYFFYFSISSHLRSISHRFLFIVQYASIRSSISTITTTGIPRIAIAIEYITV